MLGSMQAQRILCSAEYHDFEMPSDEEILDTMDLELAESESFGADYKHPLKPPIAPSATFELRRVPYGAIRDAAFADLVGVDDGFMCSLLKYRYKKAPAIQDMQFKDISRLIWHCQTSKDWRAAAPWPKTPSEQIDMIGRIILDLGHAVTLGY